MGKYLHILIIINFIYSMSGLELAQAMKNRAKPADTQSESIMVLTNKKGKKKTLKLLSKSKDDSKKQMIWFLEPKDDYGVSFLKIENSDGDDFMNMWLPGFNKFRRISSQKKTDSFMGSDLSFEDMTNREIDEYIYKTLEIDIKCNNFTEDLCYILESIPKNPKSEYSRHITWIKKDLYLSLREESYDKEDKLLKDKSIKYSKIDNYYIMNELDVKNIQKNHTTLLTINNIKVNLGFSDKIFHTKTIKRMPLN